MLRRTLQACAALVFVLLAIVPFTVRTNPSHVTFGGREYEVHYTRGHVWLTADGEYVCDLGEGQMLLHYDFNADGRADLGVYEDDRDGFRNTFSYLTLYADTGIPIRDIEPETAKWKEGHWAWIDIQNWPGLDFDRLEGVWLRHFMRAQDDAHDGWF